MHTQFWPHIACREFIDMNKTLERLINYPPASDGALQNPWKRTLPSITSQSKMVMRVFEEAGQLKEIRCVHAVELLRIVGWDLCHWEEDSELQAASAGITSDDLISLAGNAISAFAFAPLQIAFLSALGLHSEVARAREEEPLVVQSDSDELDD